MQVNPKFALLLSVMIGAGAALGGCAPQGAEAPVATGAAAADAGEIPVTTASEEARAAFLEGRALSENLRVTDSIEHFQKAVSLDPDFALAELSLANTAPTGREFFEHLDKAVRLSDKASDGERFLILATEAGANNDAAQQNEYLEKLVAAYPDAARAHFNLGGYYFGQQDYAQAIEHYKRATELAPTFSPVYNILGYAYRQAGDYANAEQAFQKYIELIPDNPNPYDSYAELLLKQGRFDDAVTQYRKALAIDPNFVNSHFGIAAARMYQGRPDDAATELAAITTKARNDGERRLALFGETVLAADGGKMDAALERVDQQYALGEAGNDVPAMAGDLQLKGNILLEMGRYDEAGQQFGQSLAMIDGSGLSQAIKDNAHLGAHFDLARVALGKKDAATAKAEAELFRTGAEASGNPAQVRQAHELAGMIALAAKDYDVALTELQQASQQNPYNLYRQCQAYAGKGDAEKAKELCAEAAGFNSLPQMNYAYVRTRAGAGASGA